MSWATLIVGDITFSQEVTQERMKDLIEKVKDRLELYPSPPKYGAFSEFVEDRTYWFINANFSSHLTKERVQDLIEEIKSEIEHCTISLYFLDSSGIHFYYYKGEELEITEIT